MIAAYAPWPASGLATSRAQEMNRSASGLSVRFFTVMMLVEKFSPGSFIGSFLSISRPALKFATEFGSRPTKRPLATRAVVNWTDRVVMLGTGGSRLHPRKISKMSRPGELRIGCPEIVMAGFLPAIIEKFARQYPRIRLHAVHANTALLEFRELRQRNVELLIGRTPMPLLDDELQLETLFHEPFVAVAALQSGWARRRRIELAELIDESWVLPPYDSAPGRLIFEIFRQCNLDPPVPGMTTLSIQLTTALVASGRFVGLLPNSVANFSAGREMLKKLPIKLPGANFSTSIITVKNRTLSPLADLFIACAREVARPLAGQAA